MAEIEPQQPWAERPAESPQSGGVSSVAGKARARSERHTMPVSRMWSRYCESKTSKAVGYYMQELGFALDWDYAGQNDLGVRAITRGWRSAEAPGQVRDQPVGSRISARTDIVSVHLMHRARLCGSDPRRSRSAVASPRWSAVRFKLEILPPTYLGFSWWC